MKHFSVWSLLLSSYVAELMFKAPAFYIYVLCQSHPNFL